MLIAWNRAPIVVIALACAAACGRLGFDEITTEDVPQIGDAVAATTTCAGVDTTGCVVVPCAATSACLLYCPGPYTAVAAAAVCASHGGELACPDRPEIVACILAARVRVFMWVGLVQSSSATATDVGWTWSCNGSAYAGSWTTGEPNDYGTIDVEDGEEQCGMLYADGRCNDGICNGNTDVDATCQVP